MDVSHKVHLVAGSTVSGTVTGFERLTTLVDLDGVPAILPLGELSWAYVVSPMDVVKVGSRYDFFIESIGSDCSKAVVSLRKLRPDPWLKVAEKYVCGTVTEGTVNRLSRNGDGAVLDLEHGVSGFLPIKEWPPRQTLEIKVGVKMKVRVTDIQPELRRMSLSAQFPAAQMHGPTHEFGKAKTKHKELARAIAMTIEDARKREVLIDGLNIARHYDELKSKALMLLVWELERNGFKWHIVFDANTAYWMMDANDVVGLKFLEYLKCEKPGSFDFCAAKTKADDCILQYADKYGNHVISCDGFSEYGDVYPWVLRLTESGRRVHPVSLVMGELQVPSLGLSISVGG